MEDNYQGKENDLAITLQIDEGPQTMVEPWNSSATKPKLDNPFPDLNISAGQAFGYSKINEDREIVLNYYFNNGFPNATFEASAKPSPSNPLLMDVVYTIHEGDQVIVDQVFTAGLNHTRPFVVQREIQIKPGDPVEPDRHAEHAEAASMISAFSARWIRQCRIRRAPSAKRMCW